MMIPRTFDYGGRNLGSSYDKCNYSFYESTNCFREWYEVVDRNCRLTIERTGFLRLELPKEMGVTLLEKCVS
jgi:hypothetical protein